MVKFGGFEPKAWKEYEKWVKNNAAVSIKINNLIASIMESGLLSGIGKPEWLSHMQAYSRHITKKDRLLYVVRDDGQFVVISCKGHNDDH